MDLEESLFPQKRSDIGRHDVAPWITHGLSQNLVYRLPARHSSKWQDALDGKYLIFGPIITNACTQPEMR